MIFGSLTDTLPAAFAVTLTLTVRPATLTVTVPVGRDVAGVLTTTLTVARAERFTDAFDAVTFGVKRATVVADDVAAAPT